MKMILTMLLGLAGVITGRQTPAFAGRMRTGDVAFQGRMGAGFPGDVNRTHPAGVEPCLIFAASPPTAYGQPVIVDVTGTGVRPFVAGDQANGGVAPWGFTVRPYPQQVDAATNFGAASLGAATPPAAGIIDVMKLGYIMAKVNVGAVPVKGQPVYVWTAATAGNHVQGGLESAASAGNATPLINCFFNSPADASNVCEIVLQA